MEKKVYSPEEASKRYAALPPEVKALIYSPEMLMIVRQIAQKYQLHIDQTGILEDETNAVMLGFTSTEDFPEVLGNALGIEFPKVQTIAQDISNLLFAKIRESMKKTSEQAQKGTALPQTPVVKPPQPTMPAPQTQVPPAPPKPPMPQPPVAPKVPPPPAQTPAANPTALPAITTPKVPAILNADIALSQKTVIAPKPPAAPPPAASAAPAQTNKPPAPPKPGGYVADPYREPIE